MATSAKPAKIEDKTEGMVLFTDGSAAPTNPGFGGWGLHGYIYSDQAPKKGSGNPSQVLTAEGYLDKNTYKANGGGVTPELPPARRADDEQPSFKARQNYKLCEVKPLSYVNGYGSFLMPVTNNASEIAGVTNALAFAANYDISKLVIRTDSQYAIDGATKWVHGWKRNNWCRQDGQQVANKDLWLTLSDNLTKLQEKGVDVQLKWCKGHSIHLGNQLADKLADVGNRYSRLGQLRTEFHKEEADGYWSAKGEKHPFISQRRIFFSTLPESIVPGEYYLGEHGKDDELIGKRTADGAHSYVELTTPEPLIELLRRKQIELASGADTLVMGRIDKLFEAQTQADLIRFGDIMLYQPYAYKQDMHVLGDTGEKDLPASNKGEKLGEPITKELKPPRLAMRAVEAVNILKGVLLSWKDKSRDDIVATDITSVLFETDAKGELKLKAEYIVGFTGFPIEVSWCATDLSKKEKIDLCMGIDIPDRNAIKRMEKLKPQVFVVTWMESDKTFRHATIVQSYGDFGIWAGMHSNLRVLV